MEQAFNGASPIMETEARPAAALVPAATRLGPVHIAVTSLERALPVWRDLVGLTLMQRSDGSATLGAGGRPLVVLEAGAERPVVAHRTGLYHVAIHVPSRRDLAIAVARLYANRFRNSPTDHLVTEADYLWDLDGNGIELTFETPWRGRLNSDGNRFAGIDSAGRPHSGREPIDLDSLFSELRPNEDLAAPLPPGTRIGHVHVHVADLAEAMRFYTETIGFRFQVLDRRRGMADVTLDYPPHILAFNTWAGEGAPPPPPGSAGLRHFSIELPDQASLDGVRERLRKAEAPVSEIDGAITTADPSGNRIRLAAAS